MPHTCPFIAIRNNCNNVEAELSIVILLHILLHIPHFLPTITHYIHQCPKCSHQWIHLFCHMKQWIMCPNAFPQRLRSNAHLASAIPCQILLQQIARSFSHHLKPKSSIIILTYILYLHQSYPFSVVHHSQASWPAAHKHSQLTHFLYSRHIHAQVLAVLTHLRIFMIREGIAILYHKLQLMLQFLRQPQVIRVKKSNPQPQSSQDCTHT